LKTGDKYCVIDSKLFCEQDARAKKQQQILKVKHNKRKTHDNNNNQNTAGAKNSYKANLCLAMQRQVTAKPESHPKLRLRDFEQSLSFPSMPRECRKPDSLIVSFPNLNNFNF